MDGVSNLQDYHRSTMNSDRSVSYAPSDTATSSWILLSPLFKARGTITSNGFPLAPISPVHRGKRVQRHSAHGHLVAAIAHAGSTIDFHAKISEPSNTSRISHNSLQCCCLVETDINQTPFRSPDQSRPVVIINSYICGLQMFTVLST